MKIRWLEAPGLPTAEAAICEVIWVVFQDPVHVGAVFGDDVYNVFANAFVLEDDSLVDLVILENDLELKPITLVHPALKDRRDLLYDMMGREPGAYAEFRSLSQLD